MNRDASQLTALLLFISVVACADSGSEPGNSTSRTDDRALLVDPGHPAWSEPAPDVYRARFETGGGDVVLEVVRGWAPIGADRLYHLVRLGFFDDQRIFRVRAGYIAQFGISGLYFLETVRQSVLLADVVSGVAKTFFFGFAIAVIACYQGLGTSGGTTGVGLATTRAVVQSSVAVLVLNFFLTKLFLLL